MTLRLLEMGRLEIQIAIPKTGTGIYHEKIGLFIEGKDFVAFTGSSNESRMAFENNRECVDVYTSWGIPSRAVRKREHFAELWERRDRGVEVFSFPEAARRKLLRVVGEWEAGRRQRRHQDSKWRHQDEASTKNICGRPWSRPFLSVRKCPVWTRHLSEAARKARCPCARRRDVVDHQAAIAVHGHSSKDTQMVAHCREGLPYIKIGFTQKSHVRYRREDVEAFLEARKSPPPGGASDKGAAPQRHSHMRRTKGSLPS